MPTTIPVVAAILQQEEKILIARKRAGTSNAGLWEFPGGKVELGETHEAALKRELKEEFNIETEIGAFCLQNVVPHPQKKIHYQISFYFVTWTAGQFTLSDHDAIKWIVPNQLNQYELVPGDYPLTAYFPPNL